MFIIGITGGIGCGKSTIAEICRKSGFTVLDADAISRQVTVAGGSAIEEITEAFGNTVLNEKGSLDREKMARTVFRDKKRLDLLSAIIHKHVIEQMQLEVEKLNKSKVRAIFLDVPIPVRHGFLDICDQVWVVWADEKVRISRLRKRGMSDDEARRRIQMQMTKDEYLKLADREIDNSGTMEELTDQVYMLMQQELAPRGIRYSDFRLLEKDEANDENKLPEDNE
jgi:dephospho-CoA kinase